MKMIRPFMGRRQFLIGAAATSALGMASRKISTAFGPSAPPGAATAEASEPSVGGTGNAADRYPHLLSPLKIRNKVLKNRMLVARGIPHFMQGPENYPPDTVRAYYAKLAQNGAIVNVNFRRNRDRTSRMAGMGDMAHGAGWDTEDPAVDNYVDQMLEGVHCMGALVAGTGPTGDTVDEVVAHAKRLEISGVDVVTMGERYTDMLDKNNRRRFIDQMQAVRSATNLLIIMWLDVIDPEIGPETSDYNVKNHYTLDQAIEVAKAYEGSADIMYFKVSGGMHNHPIGWLMAKGDPPVVRIARAIKESGAGIITCPNGGFLDPDLNDTYIEQGMTDLVGMCRAFISDPEYTEKLEEGRRDDVVPCIKCNKCHGISMEGPWYDVCSVNPKIGTVPFTGLIKAPTAKKKVAVIGGGPAGMKAAVTAAERGHAVTLYEKNDELGGLLRHTDYSPESWPLKDFKDYLIRQVAKAGVKVLLNTDATPKTVRAGGYDTVLAAAGAEPVMPRIPGAEGKHVWNFFDVYKNEKALGKKIVFIGGGEFGGVMTGMFLAKAGHNVTVITSGKEIYRNVRVHYPEAIVYAYDHLTTYDYITGAMVTGISDGKVAYTDANDKKQSIKADDVVIYGGLKARQEEALAFYDTARQFFAIGDCTERGGNVQRSIRSAFFAAARV
jgi:2,4-dienoyl-CoA reductase-like NADH-dependent reductase (Old Yellow Enzyme family)/thioredoxin reductase